MKRALAAAVSALLATAPVAGHAGAPIAATGPLRLELPLLDVPYGASHGYRAPSMAQAGAIGRDLHTATNWAIDLGVAAGCEGRGCGRSPAKRWALEWAALLLANALVAALPLYTAWTHEEYHRAVLGQHGIDSHNGVYDLELGGSAIYVSHVADEDLVRLKRDHPSDMVRLSAAGMEGDVELTRAVQADAFLDGTDSRRDVVTLLLVRANVVGYMWTCDSSRATSDQERRSAQEPDPAQRDGPVRARRRREVARRGAPVPLGPPRAPGHRARAGAAGADGGRGAARGDADRRALAPARERSLGRRRGAARRARAPRGRVAGGGARVGLRGGPGPGSARRVDSRTRATRSGPGASCRIRTER
ncbi:MAG TPA: hypothetical protein VFL83_14515 [Anaeromyxobacter sp.]|nr:hypothetical protein [Anaeromyxobacter sp.]